MNKVNEILDECKKDMTIHIDKLLELGVRRANIEIELLHHLKQEVYKDR